MDDKVDAIIRVKVPKWQIGEEVSVYFPDTMTTRGKCEMMPPQGDLISREALKEDFKSRLALCDEWIAKAKDKETKIRASAVKAFIAEVIMTIDTAPTVSDYLTEIARKNFELGRSIGKSESEIVENITRERTRKGEWIWLGDNPSPNHKWSCIKCGRGVKEQENFCPNCGARMVRNEQKRIK